MNKKTLYEIIQPPDFLARLSWAEYRTLAIPTAWAIGLLFLVGLPYIFAGESSLRTWLAATAAMVYLGITQGVVLPLLKSANPLHWVIAAVNGFIFGLMPYFPVNFKPTLVVSLVTITMVSTAGMSGRWPAYLFTLVFMLVSRVIFFTESTFLTPNWRFTMVLGTIILTETVMRLGNIVAAKIKRLEVINEISRIISATIDIDEVIPRLNQAVQTRLEADTHYLALIEKDQLKLQWFYDEGQFFPPTEVPLQHTLSGWVFRHNQSLFLRNVPVEGVKYDIDFGTVGQEKVSLSWIGTPLRTNGKAIGILAMASYKKNAFSQEDLDLLESIAQQAALVLDNAYRHAEVVDQSRRDSMTQVFNHAYFLTRLTEMSKEQASFPLGLLIVDIDHFKPFNDTYGHLIGDLALKETVRCIVNSVRSTDIIGRWGGEEFCVLLPNISLEQAIAVAERIRQSVEKASIATPDRKSLSIPTVSIGGAIYPDETNNLEALIHLADQRMYEVKTGGRNQAKLA